MHAHYICILRKIITCTCKSTFYENYIFEHYDSTDEEQVVNKFL